jgi:hypothetical protein
MSDINDRRPWAHSGARLFRRWLYGVACAVGFIYAVGFIGEYITQLIGV